MSKAKEFYLKHLAYKEDEINWDDHTPLTHQGVIHYAEVLLTETIWQDQLAEKDKEKLKMLMDLSGKSRSMYGGTLGVDREHILILIQQHWKDTKEQLNQKQDE